MSSDEITIDAAEAGRLLRDERADLERRLGRFTAVPEPGSNIGFGKRIGDGTTEAVDRLNQIGVGQHLESRLERINRALAQIDAGTYGTCEVCGEPINPRRMRAAPESTVCVTCPFPHR